MILLHGITAFLLWTLGVALVLSIFTYIILQALIGKYKDFIFKNYSNKTVFLINVLLLFFSIAVSFFIFWLVIIFADFIHH
jgi:hypothetical protein